MALILTRSPYHISKGNLDPNAGLVVEISTYADGVSNILNSYNLSFRNRDTIDISSLIASEINSSNNILYIETTVSGSISDVAQADQVNNYFASEGFLYSTDSVNKDFSADLRTNGYYAGSSDVVYKLDSSSLNVPLLNTSLTTLSANATVNGTFDTDTDWTKESGDWTISNGLSFVNSTDLLIDRLYQASVGLIGSNIRVSFEVSGYSGTGVATMRYPLNTPITGNGTYEAYGVGEYDLIQFQATADDLGSPLTFSIDNVFVSIVSASSYEEVTVLAKKSGSTVGTKTASFSSDSDSASSVVNFNIDDIDEVVINTIYATKTLKVNTISECKYSPYILTFKNKYGVYEDLWFFKKSSRKLKTEAEDFKSNQIVERLAGSLTRSIQEYNKNGKESMDLNSGFVSEALNESFKQLLLSEEVNLYDYDNNSTQAVKIASKSLDYKTVTNDKLINYTIEVEFSNNVIDDIV